MNSERPPKDTVVHFDPHAEYLGNMNYLKEKYNLSLIRPFKEAIDNGGGYVYYYVEKDSARFFIKWGGAGNSLANEVHFTNLLYKENPNNFLQVMFEEHNEKKYVAFEFLQTPTLAELLAQHNLVNKQKIILQLEKIAHTLATCKVSHRDIRPDNLLVLPDGTLKLIDMQWAVPNSPYRELNYVNEHPEQFAGLGTTYAIAQYCWDDMYSIHKLIRELGGHSDYVYSLIGKFKIQYNVQWDIISLKEQIKQLQNGPQQTQTQSINKPLTLLNCWKQIKYPKWFILFLCWFIVKKTNRRKFKKKYSIRQ